MGRRIDEVTAGTATCNCAAQQNAKSSWAGAIPLLPEQLDLFAGIYDGEEDPRPHEITLSLANNDPEKFKQLHAIPIDGEAHLLLACR